MQSKISPLARTLTPYVPGEQPGAGEAWIKLNTNENPYPPSARVGAAIQEAMGELALYPDPCALSLREAIAAQNGVTVDEVFVGNGSDEVLAMCFPAFFAGQPYPVRFADVTYSFYKVYASLFSVPCQIVPLKADYTMDVDAFCAPQCSGILIPNPNAPTGLLLETGEIERILRAHPDCVVVIDEAYIAFGGQSMVSWVRTYPNLLVVRTLSKAHALAGLRVGYAIGQQELITALMCIKDSFNSYPVDRLAQAGARAAVLDDAYTRAQCQKVQQTRAWTTQQLRARGFTVLDSAANFVFARPQDGDAARVHAALRDRHVLVRYFPGARTGEFLRISIGTDAQMRAFMEALDTI